MSGLRRICKLYGSMTVTGNGGKTIRYLWDYANDEPVSESEMPFGSERHKASERARYQPALANMTPITDLVECSTCGGVMHKDDCPHGVGAVVSQTPPPLGTDGGTPQ